MSAGSLLQLASALILCVAQIVALATSQAAVAAQALQVVGRAALVAATYLCLREATGRWSPVPFCWGRARTAKDGATRGGPPGVAERALLYSAACWAVWPVVRAAQRADGGGTAALCAVTLGAAALLRTFAAALLLYAAPPPPRHGAAPLLRHAVVPPRQKAACGGEVPLVDAHFADSVDALVWLLAPEALPRCELLCRWRRCAVAWRALLAHAPAVRAPLSQQVRTGRPFAFVRLCAPRALCVRHL